MARKSLAARRVTERLGRDSIVASYRDSSGVIVPAAFAQNFLGPRLKSRRTQYEDWIFVLMFNHLFSGLDAFIAAQLWDMPTEVTARPTADGVAVSASLAFGAARRR